MERAEQRSIAEALILASPEPIPLARLAALIPGCKPAQARALVDELNGEYAQRGRAFEISEVAGGYQLRTLPGFAEYVKASQPERPLRLSQAALETLAVVAYRQPVTRAEVEHVRGVDVGPVLRGLLERGLLRIAGHREVPGRPLLYATSRRFLEVFGLARIEELPTLRDLAELAPTDVAGATLPSVLAEAPPRAADDAGGDDEPEASDADEPDDEGDAEAADGFDDEDDDPFAPSH
jgi:segregation and condensation protein B